MARRRGNLTKGRCEGIARGNLNSSFVLLATASLLACMKLHLCVCIKTPLKEIGSEFRSPGDSNCQEYPHALGGRPSKFRIEALKEQGI